MLYIHLTQISTELCTLAKLNDSAMTRPGFPVYSFTRLEVMFWNVEQFTASAKQVNVIFFLSYYWHCFRTKCVYVAFETMLSNCPWTFYATLFDNFIVFIIISKAKTSGLYQSYLKFGAVDSLLQQNGKRSMAASLEWIFTLFPICARFRPKDLHPAVTLETDLPTLWLLKNARDCKWNRTYNGALTIKTRLGLLWIPWFSLNCSLENLRM